MFEMIQMIQIELLVHQFGHETLINVDMRIPEPGLSFQSSCYNLSNRLLWIGMLYVSSIPRPRIPSLSRCYISKYTAYSSYPHSP